MKYILAALVLTFSMQSSAEIQGDEIQWDAEIQREQSSADTWLCIADKAAGMMLENGSWESVTVKPGDKYLIKESEEMLAMNGYVYEVYQFGKDISRSQCRDFGSEEWLVGGMLVCQGVNGTFKYDPSNGHFLATRTRGYVTSGYYGVVTEPPMVEIGKCSKL